MTSFENKRVKQFDDYNTYLHLKTLKYSNDYISKHLNYSLEHLGYLISSYTFKNNIEYQLQHKKGNSSFKGKFHCSLSVQNILTTDEISEIYNFTKDLVLQHQHIYHIQTFYSIEQNCELLFIDTCDKCVLLLVNELHSLINNTFL